MTFLKLQHGIHDITYHGLHDIIICNMVSDKFQFILDITNFVGIYE